LAGAPAKDRLLIASPGSSTRWFEPMHVREPARVRGEMTDQVFAGADILLAPTWLTHRRSLVPVGETRRAQEWTSLAVGVAREAVERGRERRDDGRACLILGVLPDPDATDEAATGRQLRPDAAAERDERAQSGILAETGLTGVLIEARPSLERTRVALRAVVEHDMGAWVTIPATRADGLALAEWLDTLAAGGATTLLFESPDVAPGDQSAEGRYGVVVPGPLDVADPRGVAATWIDRGASVLGILAEATPDALRPLIEARDAALEAAVADDTAEQALFERWLGDAAVRASGGRGLWVGDAPERLPDRFDWTVVPATAVGALSSGTWRFVVSRGTLDPRDAARLVERGGIVVGGADDADTLPSRARAAGLRLDVVTLLGGGEWRYICRRED